MEREATSTFWNRDVPIKPELLVCKRDLLVSLENVDLEGLMKYLVKNHVISQEMSKYFNNLDFKSLQQEVVAGFLVNELLRSIESKPSMVQCSLDELENEFSDTKHLGAAVRSCLYTENANLCNAMRINADSPKKKASTYTNIGQKQSLPDMSTDILTFKDIPFLTEVLCKCSHKWEELGVALQLQEHELAECRKASSNALSLHKVLNKRLNFSQAAGVEGTFTLKTLKNALGSNLVGMKSLAEKLGEEYKKQKRHTSEKPRLQSSLVDENSTVMACDGKATLLGLSGCDTAELYQWKKDADNLQNDASFFGVWDDVLLVKNAR